MIQKVGNTKLTASQAGELLGVSRQRIHQLRVTGKLTGIPVETVDYAYDKAEVIRLKKAKARKAALRSAKRRGNSDHCA